MSLDLALRLTEILLALAMLQQSAEHAMTPGYERALFLLRGCLCLPLLFGFHSEWALLALFALSLPILSHFQGPYNGGSDKMTLLILTCLTAARFAPTEPLQELACGYLAAQLILSYFMSGYVKIVNPSWRSGEALCDVFRFSAYPVSEALRDWAERPRVLWTMGWAVMLFELVFPLAFLSLPSLGLALGIAALFHGANACLFGLNRFLWIWITAYPSLIWLQLRLIGG
ncbi:MAG: HTTM domain-containing protein [Mangrovicoccus sp.]